MGARLLMALDTTKYPMLGDLTNPPTCVGCGDKMIRVEAWTGVGMWLCLDLDCDADEETDAQLDDRLQSAAESAFERVQSSNLGGGSFLSPDAMQWSLKR